MTTPTSGTPERCQKCGMSLPPKAAPGLCAACMLEFGLNTTGSEMSPASGSDSESQFGDYELLGEIAHGGMGVVYRARQRSLGRIVALKTILAGRWARPEDVARFRLEAEAAAHLKHPNIVAIHEVGECDGQPFFSMDYIEGHSLSTKLREGPLPAAQAARYVEKIARAVHYAHEHGVLHRDLKPSNILLDAQDEPHITDFGLAKRLTDSELAAPEAAQLTLSGQVLGTPSFMPPEQAAGHREQMGPRSDVYSLGAILYHLLTGRPPFVGADVHTVLAQVIGSEVLTPRLLNPALPRDLETIALKCLEKDPARRYASALALAEDVARHLNHEPIHAAPPSAIYRARKFVRRHRVGVAVAACFVLVLLSATVVSTMYRFQAEHERDQAVQARNAEAAERAKALRAEGDALESARRATESAADSKAVLKFMRDKFLATARPVGEPGGLGRETTIKAALDATEPEIARTLASRPRVEVEVRETMGLTYNYLGDTARAVPQLERVLELELGDPALSEVNAIITRQSLGEMYRELGRLDEAVPMLECGVELSQRHFGTNSQETIRGMNNLAIAYIAAGAWTNALAVTEQAIQRNAAAGRPIDTEAIESTNILASVLEHQGRLPEAIAHWSTVRDGYAALLGRTNRKTLIVMNNLARCWVHAGQPTNAIVLFQEALRGLEPSLGPDHPLTLAVLDNLAEAMRQTGQWANAIELLETVQSRSLKKLGPDHTDTLTSANNLAMAYRRVRRPADAIRLWTNVVARAKAGELRSTPRWMQNLALAYEDEGQWTQAGDVLQQAMPLFKAYYGVPHQLTQTAGRMLAEDRMKAGQPDEAVQVLEDLLGPQREAPQKSDDFLTTLCVLGEANLRGRHYREAELHLTNCLVYLERIYPDDERLTPKCRSLLGAALLAQDRASEAEAPLRKAADALQKIDFDRLPRSRAALYRQLWKETLQRTVQLYDTLGRPEEAARWRAKLP